MKTIGIGLMGLGNVASGVWKIIEMNQKKFVEETGHQVKVQRILVRDMAKIRSVEVPKELITSDLKDITEEPSIDIVIELIGGFHPAKEYIEEALKNQKHVVTANKAVIAHYGDELLKLADVNGVYLHFEGSVAGGIPIIETIKESLTANEIDEIKGIVNGTTNYILTKMTLEGDDFQIALQEAQSKGYAEADPTADVDGFDAAYKLSILSSLAFQTPLPINGIHREGIRKITPLDIEYARELGYTIKLLAIGKRKEQGLELRVHPTLIPSNHPLSSVNNSFNAIYLKGNAVGELMLYGRGAGDLPTGSAVLGDLISIIKKLSCQYFQRPRLTSCPSEGLLKSMDETISDYYIRIVVKDIPGVLGQIASLFGQNQVSLSTVIQKGLGEPEVSLVFITHSSRESNVQKTLQEVVTIPQVKEIANLIRVEG